MCSHGEWLKAIIGHLGELLLGADLKDLLFLRFLSIIFVVYKTRLYMRSAEFTLASLACNKNQTASREARLASRAEPAFTAIYELQGRKGAVAVVECRKSLRLYFVANSAGRAVCRPLRRAAGATAAPQSESFHQSVVRGGRVCGRPLPPRVQWVSVG